MRYTSEYKKQARSNLIQAGARHAKANGFSNSATADIAAQAGVTTGSLYKHFNGKSELFVAIIAAELKLAADLYEAVDATDAAQVSKALEGYLSLSHVRNPALGCPLPSLSSDVARADDLVKDAFENGIQEIHTSLKALVGDADTAWAVMAQNVGAIFLARGMRKQSLQRELLNAVRKAGEELISGRRVEKSRHR